MARAGTPHWIGVYLALVQLLFTLGWTAYALYLPRLAAQVGLPASAVALILILNQMIFTVCDFATGIAADKVSRTLGRLGYLVVLATIISCAAFLAMPYVAAAGASTQGVFLALTLVWAISSSALRAPPIMLLGKYAARPAIPYLSSLVMVGYGLAGAAAPYLGLLLRDQDPRLPFAISSATLVLTTIGLISVERALARRSQQAPAEAAPAPPAGSMAWMTAIFGLAILTLALGYQMHFSINSPQLYLRFVERSDLERLTPIFWVGFNVAMFPASLLTKRWGGLTVMGIASLIGAAAVLAADLAQQLGFLLIAQLAAGASWGCILMSAFSAAFAIGQDGAQGKMTGLLFSALALATAARLAAVAGGLQADSTFAAATQWIPTLCWAGTGAMLLYYSVAFTRRRLAAT
jgi:hypothetical protein